MFTQKMKAAFFFQAIAVGSAHPHTISYGFLNDVETNKDSNARQYAPLPYSNRQLEGDGTPMILANSGTTWGDDHMTTRYFFDSTSSYGDTDSQDDESAPTDAVRTLTGDQLFLTSVCESLVGLKEFPPSHGYSEIIKAYWWSFSLLTLVGMSY